MPALLFIVCFLTELCDYPVFRIGLHSAKMRRATSAQLFGEETGKSSPKMWIASSWIIFQHYYWSNGMTYGGENFCDLMILWLCIDTFKKRTPKFIERNSTEFQWGLCWCVCVWWTLKLELYTITWHLKFAFEMRWGERVYWRECDNLIFRSILFVSMCKIHSMLLTLDHWNLYWDC